MRNEKGFSLIELMIVVVIIGILSTIAVPQYQNFQKKARQSEAKAALGSLYTTMKTFQAEWNNYYSDFRALGFDQAGTLAYGVGFAAPGGPAGPVGHPAYAGIAPAQYNSQARCLVIPDCTTAPTSAVPTGTLINNAVPQTFIAGARGNIDADATIDNWTIDQNKALTQPVAAERDVDL